MITPSTDVARGGLSNPETRTASRTESGADFREEVSRERARERSNERARVAESDRAGAADPRPRDEGQSGVDATRVETEADGSADSERDATAVARGDAARQVAEPDATGEQDPTRPTASSETPKDAAPPRATKPETEALAPGTQFSIVQPALEPTDAARASAATGRSIADASAPAEAASAREAVAGVGAPLAKPLAHAPALAPEAQFAIPDAGTHDATLPEGLELPREHRSAHAADAGTNALAAAARGPTSIADLSPAATTAPVAATRLAPADLPQFLRDLQVRVDGAAGSALVELEPLELGRLTVELSLQPEGGVRADVRAERPDGYAAIEARLPELRASLMDRGFASADVQVSLGLAPRDPRRDAEAGQSRRTTRNTGRQLDAERVLALAPARTGSIDLWA